MIINFESLKLGDLQLQKTENLKTENTKKLG